MSENYENQVEKTLVERQKVNMFIMSNHKYFPSKKMMFLKEKLYSMDEQKFSMPCLRGNKSAFCACKA